jgi:hypothetical protein
MLIYTHCWELMNSVGSHGSLSLPFVMKVMVCHFVSDSHEFMTALIVALPIIVVEISLQLHQAIMDFLNYVLALPDNHFFSHCTKIGDSRHVDMENYGSFWAVKLGQIGLSLCDTW